jgi:hypothetical protein
MLQRQVRHQLELQYDGYVFLRRHRLKESQKELRRVNGSRYSQSHCGCVASCSGTSGMIQKRADIQRGDIHCLVASWAGHSIVRVDSGHFGFFPVQEYTAVHQLLVDL